MSVCSTVLVRKLDSPEPPDVAQGFLPPAFRRQRPALFIAPEALFASASATLLSCITGCVASSDCRLGAGAFPAPMVLTPALNDRRPLFFRHMLAAPSGNAAARYGMRKPVPHFLLLPSTRCNAVERAASTAIVSGCWYSLRPAAALLMRWLTGFSGEGLAWHSGQVRHTRVEGSPARGASAHSTSYRSEIRCILFHDHHRCSIVKFS